ncbi:hypothetical protein RCL1_007857 [Eukaryota sp. TZLM3-RCL]
MYTQSDIVRLIECNNLEVHEYHGHVLGQERITGVIDLVCFGFTYPCVQGAGDTLRRGGTRYNEKLLRDSNISIMIGRAGYYEESNLHARLCRHCEDYVVRVEHTPARTLYFHLDLFSKVKKAILENREHVEAYHSIIPRCDEDTEIIYALLNKENQYNLARNLRTDVIYKRDRFEWMCKRYQLTQSQGWQRTNWIIRLVNIHDVWKVITCREEFKDTASEWFHQDHHVFTKKLIDNLVYWTGLYQLPEVSLDRA